MVSKLLSKAISEAAAATTVLPEPTSPSNNLLVGFSCLRSLMISAIAFF